MTTLASPAPAAATRPRAAVKPVTLTRVVASEWIKFRTIRSTFWTLPVTALLMIGLAVLYAWGATTVGPEEMGAVDGASVITSGWYFAQLAVSVLAILTISGEYSTGMIRSTLAAVPKRLPALWAKAAVLAVVVAVVSVIAVALAWVAVLPFADQLDLSLDLGDPSTLRMVAGAPLYLATIAVFAFAIGALMRHSAGALAVVLGLLLVIENVFALIPLRFFELVSPFLPSTAGTRLLLTDETLDSMNRVEDAVQLSAWQGYGVLVVWTVVLLVLAAVLLRRRDA
ncbi:ABC transporter permease subunit [Actinotalea subterranea]|uniref:ABC transporter permease subunit n=1 Tax=Actinotalea subterranea TaxID=2607497 RepID=UPI0011EE2DE6|nr:ABC transporter permease subunit [Actinotalea subterranea]